MINDTKLSTISQTEFESYLREAKAFAPKLSRFIVKNRVHIGAAYLALDFFKKDIEKNYPESKRLLVEAAESDYDDSPYCPEKT